MAPGSMSTLLSIPLPSSEDGNQGMGGLCETSHNATHSRLRARELAAQCGSAPRLRNLPPRTGPLCHSSAMSLWRVAGIAVLAGACVTSCAGRIDPEWERFLAEDEARWQQARADARAVGVETPPDIPEQPLISGMLLWGADIAVITEDFVSDTRRWKYALWILDQDRGILRPFTEVPCASYHDVAHTARLGRLLVCEKGETTQLLRQVDGRWNEVALAPAGQRVRVVADDQHIILASEQTLVVLSVASFATVASVATPKVGSGVSPSAMLLAEDRLLIGFSAGEFGGGLYRYTLATGVPTLDPVLLLPENMSALMRSTPAPSGPRPAWRTWAESTADCIASTARSRRRSRSTTGSNSSPAR